jgi:hypothetical protein
MGNHQRPLTRGCVSVGLFTTVVAGVVWTHTVPVAAQSSDSTPPAVTARSASEALQILLDFGIDPGGPLSGDGATIAGVLAGQSLTFPIASSSGAFVTRELRGFGPGIPVATSGSFGPLFAERGLTNGRGNLSIGFSYQHKQWRSISGLQMKGSDLTRRAVFRTAIPGRGPAGTVEEATANIGFLTDVFVLAVNYGVLSSFDAGVSLPYVRAIVEGTKQQTRSQLATGTVVLRSQEVSGRSEGVGDPIARFKYRIPVGAIARGGNWTEGLQLATGWDWRVPLGRTADLYLDCSRPPCAGGRSQAVPDVGLGKTTHKFALMGSAEFGRVSPHVNMAHIWVPSYPCDRNRFDPSGDCKGSIFELDTVNGTQDAKNQNLADEWNATIGLDYQLVPYKATLSLDVIGRQLIRAGQFFQDSSRVIVRGQSLDPSVTTEIVSRHGNVNTLVGVVGGKFGFRQRWVLVSDVLFPLNSQGLQPSITWVVGLERAFSR